MAQEKPKKTLLEMLSIISALYQMSEITSEQKNKMVGLARQGHTDEYVALYEFACGLPASPYVENLKEAILFRE